MSETLASLTSDVYEITKRPDLAAATVMHIKNALLKAHSSDFYLRDIFETTFQFGAPGFIYQFEPKSIVPRYRSMKYLTIIDPITLEFVRELKPIPLEKFLDGYGYIRTDVFYAAGSQIQIRSSTNDTVFGLGCYLYPDTTLVAPSWIADEFKFAIVYEAARTLFKTIGFDSQSAAMNELVKEAMAEIKQTGITTVGE